MSKPRFAFASLSTLIALAVAMTSSSARAGTELIALTGQAAAPYQSTISSVIPITVKLTSGQPDYIDMTYYAYDANGDSVQVSPASNRFHFTRGQSATDNVVVTKGSAAFNVTFVAYAQGEAANGDSESYTQILTSIGTGGTTSGATAPPTPGSFPSTLATPTRINGAVYTVPIAASLTSSGAAPTFSTVTLQYKATDTVSSTTVIPFRPVHENIALLSGATINPTRSVLVHVGSDMNAINLSVTPQLTGATATTYQINSSTAQTGTYSSWPVTTPSGTSTGTLTLTVGPSNLLLQMEESITFTPISDGHVKLYYAAIDANNLSHECIPSNKTYDGHANVALTDNVKIDLSGFPPGTPPQVTFTAVAVDEDGNVTSKALSFNP